MIKSDRYVVFGRPCPGNRVSDYRTSREGCIRQVREEMKVNARGSIPFGSGTVRRM